MPVAIAPTGLTGMQHADGEILAARAAEAFGMPFTLSTMSICSIEDVAAHTKAPFWFQLYVMRDRDFIERLIDRAKAAQLLALMLTLDLQILGQRHKDLKNGLSAPPKPTLANMINLPTKPRWCLGMLGTKRRSLRQHRRPRQGRRRHELASASGPREQFDPRLNWDDVEWIKKRWGGKLILKGILDVEDARLAADSGADALVVCNHGGRQLDGAPSSIEALPAIVEAVGRSIEVWMDGGIRCGQDVLKAWALGARGTLIGRAFLYGLGAMGEAGVHPLPGDHQREVDLTMAFCGRTHIARRGPQHPAAGHVSGERVLAVRWAGALTPAALPRGGRERARAIRAARQRIFFDLRGAEERAGSACARCPADAVAPRPPSRPPRGPPAWRSRRTARSRELVTCAPRGSTLSLIGFGDASRTARLRHGRHRALFGDRHQHEELLAAEAVEALGGADRLPRCGAKAPQHRVADAGGRARR